MMQRRERSSVHMMHISLAELSDDRKIEMVDKKQEETVCGKKEGLHHVYTGLDKATVENHLKFVSMS